MANNQVSIWGFADGAFSDKPWQSRTLYELPTDLEFTPSANEIALVYPNRIEMFASRNFRTTFAIVASSRIESISFGSTSEEMVIGSNEGALKVKSARLSGDAYRHQRWSLSKVAWNPHHDCIAVGQDGLLRIVDGNLHLLDFVGGVKMVEDVTMHSSNRYGFLFRSGKTVCTDGDGVMLGWSTFLPEGNQVADSFVATPIPGMIGVSVSPSQSGLMEVPICKSRSSAESFDHDDRLDAMQTRLVRHHNQNNKNWVEVWDAEIGKWEPTIKTNGYIKASALSPGGQRLAALAANHQLVIADVPSGNEIVNRTLDEVALQNTIVWINDGTLLVSGASDMTSRMMASYDIATDRLNWLQHESHDCTAAEIALLGNDTFIQAGSVFNVRSIHDGQVQRSIHLQRESGRRHGRVYRPRNSNRLFSFGYDYAISIASNASDGVVCWDSDTLTPLWNLVDVGEEQTLTLNRSGQIISATPNATENLVWIVESGDSRRLIDHDEFQQLTKQAVQFTSQSK